MSVQTKNLFALILFACSLLFLIASSSGPKAELMITGNCYHCGTVSACQNGGQAYGYFDCHYDEEEDQIIAALLAVLVVDQIPVIIRNVQLNWPVAGLDLDYCVSYISDSFQAMSQKL